MRIGINIGADGNATTLAQIIALAQRVEELGLDNVWMANIFSFDAISTLSLIGQSTRRIGLGTAVTPTYPRHPTALAQQALTAAAASENRFSLGIGLSHQVVIENMLGLSYAKPVRHMKEYLSVLIPLLGGETVSFSGSEYRVNGVTLSVPGAEKMPVIVAALGPMMLKLVGEMADGTTTWMVGPKTMEQHVIKGITSAARAAGREDPIIVGGFPVVLTNDPVQARQRIGETLTIYGQLPSYRAMLDREGAEGPADIALAGDEAYLRSAIQRLTDIGVTDFAAAIADVEDGAFDRTLEFLADYRKN